MKSTIYQNTNRKNFLQLINLRLIAILSQIVTILFAHHTLDIGLPLTSMFGVLICLSIINGVSFYHYKSQKNISNQRLFIELLFDVGALTAQLYFSGGIANPFISLFLLQVIIGAILLHQTYALLITGITIGCYIWLSVNHIELHALHHHTGGSSFFNLHLQGMLISYIIAAILLLIFITKITKNLKEGDIEISRLKRQALEKEQVIRMGLLATSTAHELSTPLSTIAVILGDWKNMKLEKSIVEDVKTVESQLTFCKKVLSKILSSSGKMRIELAKPSSVKQNFKTLITEWESSRKPQNLNYNFYGNNAHKIILDELLAQTCFNIFDNAIEASPDFIAVNVETTDDMIIINVEDHGDGFDKKVIKEIGKPNISTKNSNGLGLFLALNTLNRIDGNLEINNLKSGAKVTITIPLKNL